MSCQRPVFSIYCFLRWQGFCVRCETRPGQHFRICNCRRTFLKMNPQSENVDFQTLSWASSAIRRLPGRVAAKRQCETNRVLLFLSRGWSRCSSTKWLRSLQNILLMKYLPISLALVYFYFICCPFQSFIPCSQTSLLLVRNYSYIVSEVCFVYSFTLGVSVHVVPF